MCSNLHTTYNTMYSIRFASGANIKFRFSKMFHTILLLVFCKNKKIPYQFQHTFKILFEKHETHKINKGIYIKAVYQ